MSSFLFGSDDKFNKMSTMSGGQEKFFNQYMKQMQGMMPGMKQATGMLQQYMDPNSDVYKNFEKPYMQQFEDETVPMLAERFAGMGGGMGGGLSSSGFGQSLGAAGSQLQTNLAQMKSQMQRQSIMDMLSQFNQMSGLGLGTQSFSYGHQPASQGLVPGAVNAFAQGAGKAFAGG